MNKTTYHCHSTWSDGNNTVREMVLEAIDLGFTEIGFADHLVLHPTIAEIDWSIRDAEELQHYIEDVYTEQIRNRNDISVKLGLEVDFFPENMRMDELYEILDIFNFDFLIASVHMLDEFPIDYMWKDWQRLSQDETNAYFIKYWQNVKLLAESDQFDCVGHLDLPKIFRAQPNIDLSSYIQDALDAISSVGMAVEINTAGLDKHCKEMYPSLDILKLVAEANIPVIINDDAHDVEQLGRYYDEAQELLNASGAKQITRLPI
ncbi:MAG: histidinol-phosphatase [Kiritimatiellae bacterium]|jgi:histidinol-phosphatase (PHP family)|nr:histidinol-phosphatase [Kiritimatiellia bacterium]